MRKITLSIALIISILVTVLSSSGVYGTALGVPSCWVLSSGGTAIDSNCDGIVDQAINAQTLGGIAAADYMTTTDNTSIWSAINLKIDSSDEGNLNVNSSTYWAAVNGWTAGWFLNSGDKLTFNYTKISTDYYNKTEVNSLIAGVNVSIVNYSEYTNISNLQMFNYTDLINDLNNSLIETNNTLNNITVTSANYSQYTNISNLQDLNFSSAIDSLNSSKYNTTGGIINGNVIIEGNLTILGDYINATVTDQYLNGTFSPAIGGVFDIGSASSKWDKGYFNTLIGDLNSSFVQNQDEMNVNSSNYWDSYDVASDLNYQIASSWNNLSDVPYLLSNFTDDLGDRGYTHLSNFTNDMDLINSTYANDTYLKLDDQRFNETGLINLVNTTENIMSLGFYNSTFSNSTYVNVDGDTMTGDLAINANLSLNGINASTSSTNGLWTDGLHIYSRNSSNNQLLFTVNGPGRTGTVMPHFWIQNGADSSASGVSRSFMIVNEVASQQNTTNITSCVSYMAYANETLQIDCNTTTTGADLLVGDDLQVVGDVWLKDGQGEWHYMTKELSVLDSLQANTVQGNVVFDHNDTNFTVYNQNDPLLIVNINGNNTYLYGNQTIGLNKGSNLAPVNNYISFKSSSGVATLSNDVAYPEGINHADVAVIIKGADTDYLHTELPTATRKFIYNVYDQALYGFQKYISGFSPAVNSTEVSFTSGEYWQVLMEFESDNALNTTVDGFFIVLNNGTFVECTDLSCITQYNDGNAIAANAYVNLIWAVVPDSDNTSRLVVIPQNTPGSTYTTVSAAEQDVFGTITFNINNVEINKHKLTLIRTIFKNSDDLNYAFASGVFYKTIVGLTPAGAAAGGTNDHSLLSNLDYASSGHTGFASYADLVAVNDSKVNVSDITNLNVNSSVYWGGYSAASDLDYKILSYWNNITDKPTFLSNFSNDLQYVQNNTNVNFINVNATNVTLANTVLQENSTCTSICFKGTSCLHICE